MNFKIFACLAICGLLSTPAFAHAQSCCSQAPGNFSNSCCDNGGCGSFVGSASSCCDAGCGDYGCGSNNGCGAGGTTATNYLSAFGGWTDWFDLGANADFNLGGAGTATADIETTDGFGIGVALGRYLNESVRSEFEFAYRNNELESLSGSAVGVGAGTANLNGDINVFSGMYNMYYDFGRSSSRLRPYVGGGAGFAFVNTDANSAALGNIQVSTETSTFAYQGMAGVTWQWTDRIDLFTEYRVFGIGEQSLSVNVPGTGAASLNFDGLTHNIFVGARMVIR